MFEKLINDDDIPIIEEAEDGYNAIYKDRREYHKTNMLQWKSKEQLEKERPKYALLEPEDYELKIIDVEETTQKKYKGDGEEDIVNVRLEVVGYKDGSEASDADGKPASGRMVFFTIRPASMGFMRDGTPSKSRAFLAYATGQDIEGDLQLEAWEELLGKTIYAEIIKYTNTKGDERNKISRILPPPRSKK